MELCRWPLARLTTLPLEWSDDMAYLVGLTATDGCLITGRRAINFKSGDRQLVETSFASSAEETELRASPQKRVGSPTSRSSMTQRSMGGFARPV